MQNDKASEMRKEITALNEEIAKVRKRLDHAERRLDRLSAFLVTVIGLVIIFSVLAVFSG